MTESYAIQRAIEQFDVELFVRRHCVDVKVSGDEIEALCVNCKSHEMSINLDKKLGQCWSCGWKFNLIGLVAKTLEVSKGVAKSMIIRDTLLVIDRDLTDWEDEVDSNSGDARSKDLKPLPLPEGFLGLNEVYTKATKSRARQIAEFLQSRGFGSDIWRAYHFGFSLQRLYWNKVIIPITLDGEFIYFTTRTIKGVKGYRNVSERKGYHTKNTVVFGLDHLNSKDDYFCIGEGPLDALSLPNGLAALGKSWSEIQVGLVKERVPNPILYICLDGGCYRESYKLAEAFVENYEVRIVEFPEGTDPNDHIKDIETFLNLAKPYDDRLSQLAEL